MQKVLVLGGTQFFGKRLVEKLIQEGKKVTIATRGLTPDFFGDKVDRLVVDRVDKESIVNAVENRSWDIVYDQTCYSPTEAKDVAEALKGKVKRYIFTSTMAVYDFGAGNKEDDFEAEKFEFTYKGRREYPGYLGYQEAKRAAEAYLFNETEFEVVAVRFPIVIGKDDYTYRLKFHVDKVMDEAEIGISDLNARYSYILSNEAADFLYGIGQSTFTGAINPGCKGDISMEELMAKIEAKLGKKAKITAELTQENASPYALPGSWSIDNSKAERLGFQFSDLNETLDELIDFYTVVKQK